MTHLFSILIWYTGEQKLIFELSGSHLPLLGPPFLPTEFAEDMLLNQPTEDEDFPGRADESRPRAATSTPGSDNDLGCVCHAHKEASEFLVCFPSGVMLGHVLFCVCCTDEESQFCHMAISLSTSIKDSRANTCKCYPALKS